MADQTAFETRLADAYLRYVEGVPVSVDASSVARVAIEGAQRRGLGVGPLTGLRWSPWSRTARLALVAALVLSLAVSMIWVAGMLLKSPPPLPNLSPLSVMAVPRVNPIVVALEDGRVLIAGGGVEGTGEEAPVVELLDPATGEATTIDGETPSGFGTGAPLADGRVLVVADDPNLACPTAFIVDPVGVTSRALAVQGRCSPAPLGFHATSARMTGGSVLITGGRVEAFEARSTSAAVVFDPATETFTETSPMSTPRVGHGVAILGDGRIFVAGGNGGSPDGPLATIEIYDPATGSFAVAGAMLAIRGATSALTLPDGRVLLVPDVRQGGDWLSAAFRNGPRAIDPPVPVEIFDPASGRSSVVGSVPHPVSGVFLMAEGRVLVHGWVLGRVMPSGRLGASDVGFAWAAVLDPETGEAVDLPAPRTSLSSSAQLSDGRVVLAGGLDFPPLNSRGRASGPSTVSPSVDVFD